MKREVKTIIVATIVGIIIGWYIFLAVTLVADTQGDYTALLPIIFSFVFMVLIIILFQHIRKKRGETVNDERLRFIRTKANSFAYAFFYIGSYLMGNVALYLYRRGNQPMHYVATTLFVSVGISVLVNLIASWYYKTKY